jgi:hypothetical protein
VAEERFAVTEERSGVAEERSSGAADEVGGGEQGLAAAEKRLARGGARGGGAALRVSASAVGPLLDRDPRRALDEMGAVALQAPRGEDAPRTPRRSDRRTGARRTS